MRLRCPPNTASRALRRPYICPTCLVQLNLRRSLSTQRSKSDSKPKRKEIAVLGGGITGLTSAYHLSKKLPDAHITIYEKTSRLGGWVDSERLEVNGGEIVFEHGPHTLRPSKAASMVPLKMISELGLNDELIRTSSNSAGARNRFIYYPDHLVRLPAPLPGASVLMNIVRNVMSVTTEPLYGGMKGLFALLKEPFVDGRDPSIEDESVGSFLSRRFGPTMADNIASAGMHGIYAGDIYQLSAQALLTLPYALELQPTKVLASVIRLTSNGSPTPKRDHDFMSDLDLKSLPDVAGISVYTLRKGLSQLVDAVVDYLHSARNVTILTSCDTPKIEFTPGKEHVQFSFPGASDVEPRRYDYVISTLKPATLASATSLEISKASKTVMSEASHAVTVMVVNLWFPNPQLLPYQGFGYLIPRTIPYEQNPEHALGVIFASESSRGQDTAPGTKLTIMFGGHWWDDWMAYPTEDEALQMSRSLLERHLGIRDIPMKTSVRLQKDCIPQYRVGHQARMKGIHQVLQRFEGRVKVAGCWYHGVGLNDCMRAGADAASLVENEVNGEWPDVQTTGLEWVVQDPEYLLLMRKGADGSPGRIVPIDEFLAS